MQIVVATNVAETSITIDDVTCVIDAGRVKELGYDTGRGIARLQVSLNPNTRYIRASTCANNVISLYHDLDNKALIEFF